MAKTKLTKEEKQEQKELEAVYWTRIFKKLYPERFEEEDVEEYDTTEPSTERSGDDEEYENL